MREPLFLIPMLAPNFPKVHENLSALVESGL